jgi:hypothetical protein
MFSERSTVFLSDETYLCYYTNDHIQCGTNLNILNGFISGEV